MVTFINKQEMEGLLQEFFWLSDASLRYVVIGSVLLGVSTSTTGVFALWKGNALAGDAIAHALLPGICLSFMFTGEKHPVFLLFGAFITGWVALFVMNWITRNTPLKPDTATGMVLSVFFGLGILLLTGIQQTGNGQQAGLDTFLFGRAASIGSTDFQLIALVTLFILLVLVVQYRPFKLLVFDPAFARTTGLSVWWLEILLSTLMVLSICVGIRAVGVVLTSALFIMPGVAARYWTHNLALLLVLAGLFGAISAWGGALVSYLKPALPTGPLMVLVLALIVGCSLVFGSNRIIKKSAFVGRKNQHNRPS